MSLTEAKDLATIIGVVIAIVTLVKAFLEFKSQGTQRRAEHFLGMRVRFKENVVFKELCGFLEQDDEKLKDLPLGEKLQLAGFFEEVALMVNSGLIREKVAHYMFGYYAIKCWESSHFWNGLEQESPYWHAFKSFYLRLKRLEGKFRYGEKHYKF